MLNEVLIKSSWFDFLLCLIGRDDSIVILWEVGKGGENVNKVERFWIN